MDLEPPPGPEGRRASRPPAQPEPDPQPEPGPQPSPRISPLAGDFAAYSDTVLYDVFYETGTQLGAHLIRLERAARAASDPEQASRWRDRRLSRADERDNVGGADRDAQISTLIRWRAEINRLKTLGS